MRGGRGKILFLNGELNLLCPDCCCQLQADRSWSARTGSGPMLIPCDIVLLQRAVDLLFADDRTSVFQSSCCCWSTSQCVVWGVTTAGRAEAWSSSGRCPSQAVCGFPAAAVRIDVVPLRAHPVMEDMCYERLRGHYEPRPV